MIQTVFFLSIGEDQKVTPSDVAFYGLHVIIPLMSPEVLKVSSSAFAISHLFSARVSCELFTQLRQWVLKLANSLMGPRSNAEASTESCQRFLCVLASLLRRLYEAGV